MQRKPRRQAEARVRGEILRPAMETEVNFAHFDLFLRGQIFADLFRK